MHQSDGANEGGGKRGIDDKSVFHGAGVGGGGYRKSLVGVQADRGTVTSQPADHLLLAVREVHRRPRAGRAASALRRGRSRQLRHHRAHRCDRAVRAGPQSAVRDLRHSADQGGDHRRAAIDRLGSPVRAHQGPGGRAGVHPPGGDAAAHAERGGGRSRAGDVRGRLPQGAAQDLDRRHDGARRGAARRRPLRALDAGRDAAGRVVGPGRHVRGQGVQGGARRGRRRACRSGSAPS